MRRHHPMPLGLRLGHSQNRALRHGALRRGKFGRWLPCPTVAINNRDPDKVRLQGHVNRGRTGDGPGGSVKRDAGRLCCLMGYVLSVRKYLRPRGCRHSPKYPSVNSGENWRLAFDRQRPTDVLTTCFASLSRFSALFLIAASARKREATGLCRGDKTEGGSGRESG